MSPIRIAIIGLGKGSQAFDFWAAQIHLPYLQASPDFEVTAICNSTVESAQASIDFHKLPRTVKAYGSVNDLTLDANVDMVLISVRVGAHYELSKPLIESGKDLFVEWPLAATPEEAEELAAIAKCKGVKTVVGTQARASPLVVTLRNIISSGEIGEIVSTVATDNISGLHFNNFPSGADYHLSSTSGGNTFSSYIAHFLDSFLHILGPFATPSSSSVSSDPLTAHLSTLFPTTTLISPSTGAPLSTIQKTAPDHILITFPLSSGALASLTWYTTPAPLSSTELRWNIIGTKGEIEVVGTPAPGG